MVCTHSFVFVRCIYVKRLCDVEYSNQKLHRQIADTEMLLWEGSVLCAYVNCMRQMRSTVTVWKALLAVSLVSHKYVTTQKKKLLDKDWCGEHHLCHRHGPMFRNLV